MTSETKCPKCGAERTQEASSRIENMVTFIDAEVYACKSFVHFIDGFRQSKSCKIAELTRERDEARAELAEEKSSAWKALVAAGVQVSDIEPIADASITIAGCVRQLASQLTAATTRAEQSEAECAVMRAAITAFLGETEIKGKTIVLNEFLSWTVERPYKRLQAALSGNAGRELLAERDRLAEKVEVLREAIKVVRSQYRFGGKPSEITDEDRDLVEQHGWIMHGEMLRRLTAALANTEQPTTPAVTPTTDAERSH